MAIIRKCLDWRVLELGRESVWVQMGDIINRSID